MSYSELEIAYSKAEQTPNIMLISQITLWGRYAMYRYKMTPSFVANVIQGLQLAQWDLVIVCHSQSLVRIF